MIQLCIFFLVLIIGCYMIFDNLDFGIVKGFLFVYDLCCIGNVFLNLNYIFQFVDGIGLNVELQCNVVNCGVFCMLFLFNFDECYCIVVVLDYCYGLGKQYNGLCLFGLDIFVNVGLNLQVIVVFGCLFIVMSLFQELSGVGVIGFLNGVCLFWNYVFNVWIDKNFNIGKNMGFNIYCWVFNFFDCWNVINVYFVIGFFEDDGYLVLFFGQS